MKDLILLPSMENTCSNDDLRPVLQHIFLTKENFVSTDAHAMVWHNTKDHFDEDFIEKIPEDGILIHKEDWKKMKKCSVLEWKGEMIKITYAKNRPVVIEPETQVKVGKYPNWKNVIPEVNKEEPVCINEIGINPDVLIRAKKSIGDGDTPLKLTFSGKNKAILLSLRSDTEDKYCGLVMPVMLN